MKKSLIPILFAGCIGLAACSTSNDPEPKIQKSQALINFSGDVRMFDEFGHAQSPEGAEITLGSSGTVKTLSTAAGTYSFKGISLPGAERFLNDINVQVHKEGYVDTYQKPVNLEFSCTLRFQLHNASTSVISALQAQAEGEYVVVRGALINNRAKAGDESWATLFVGIDKTDVSVSQSDQQYSFPVMCSKSGVPTAFTYRIKRSDFPSYGGDDTKLTLVAYGNIPSRLDDGRADVTRMLSGYPKMNTNGQSYVPYPGLGPLPSEKVTVSYK